MRFKLDEPNLCEKRSVIKFAYFPIMVEDKKIWLKRYVSHQKYVLNPIFGHCHWEELSRELIK